MEARRVVFGCVSRTLLLVEEKDPKVSLYPLGTPLGVLKGIILWGPWGYVGP